MFSKRPTSLAGLFLLAALLSPLAVTLRAEPRFRGLWVDAFGSGFLNPEEVKKLAADCRKYNFNAVLVEMRKRGDAFYFPQSPNQDPRAPMLATNFDALAEIIRECHSGTPRIEVHCWLVSHFVWSWRKPPPQANHVVNLHPEYLTRDSIGQKWIGNGYYLDPGNPDANQTIHDAAVDIVSRYDIDGLHWDYCRYPAQDSGYNETALKRYKAESGTTADPPPSDRQFSDWRRKQVTDFMRWVNADLWAIKPDLTISASVFSSIPDSINHRLADWPAWNREGLIDISIPMDFSEKKTLFESRAAEALTNQGTRIVYLGQGGYKNTARDTVLQFIHASDLGFNGTVFYDYRHPNSGTANPGATFAVLASEYQPTLEPTPVLPWKKATGIIKGTVTSASKPLHNVTVSAAELTTPSTLHSSLPSPRLRTEPHGSYAFFNLKPGSYSVAVGAISKTIKLHAGQVLTCDFSIPGLDHSLDSQINHNNEPNYANSSLHDHPSHQ